MTILQPKQNLITEMLSELWFDSNALSIVGTHELFEIMIEKLEDEKENGLTLTTFGMNDFFQTDDIWGFERAKNGNLTESSGWYTFIIRTENGFLEGDDLTSLDMFCLVDLAVCSLAKQFCATVVLHCGMGWDGVG